jgi:hypothetical protein
MRRPPATLSGETCVTSVTLGRYTIGAGAPPPGTPAPRDRPPTYRGRGAPGQDSRDRPKGPYVPLVQIRCPNSGLWASTGIRLDLDEWESTPLQQQELACPICGQTHAWSKDDARIVTWA